MHREDHTDHVVCLSKILNLSLIMRKEWDRFKLRSILKKNNWPVLLKNASVVNVRKKFGEWFWTQEGKETLYFHATCDPQLDPEFVQSCKGQYGEVWGEATMDRLFANRMAFVRFAECAHSQEIVSRRCEGLKCHENYSWYWNGPVTHARTALTESKEMWQIIITGELK